MGVRGTGVPGALWQGCHQLVQVSAAGCKAAERAQGEEGKDLLLQHVQAWTFQQQEQARGLFDSAELSSKQLVLLFCSFRRHQEATATGATSAGLQVTQNLLCLSAAPGSG